MVKASDVLTNPQRIAEILIDSQAMPWQPKSRPGLYEKPLWKDEATGASVALIRFAEGLSFPTPHSHASNQFMFCLSGRYEFTATHVVLVEGSFYCNPKGNPHGPAVAHEETIVLEFYDGPH